MKSVSQKIKSLEQDEIKKFLANKKIEILGHVILLEEVSVQSQFCGDSSKYESSSAQDLLLHPGVSIVLDIELNECLVKDGVIRHAIHHIQRMRKEAGVRITDSQSIYYFSEGPLKDLLDSNSEIISKRIDRSFSPTNSKMESSRGSIDYSPELGFPGQNVTFYLECKA